MEHFVFQYKRFQQLQALPEPIKGLAMAAFSAIDLAYAPYSNFKVGAAILLQNEALVLGSNQENASYPAGICAERVALGNAATLYPAVPIKAIAIAYRNDSNSEKNDLVLSPCGICRQSLLEAQKRQDTPIEVIMCSNKGNGILVNDTSWLLPFAFSSQHL